MRAKTGLAVLVFLIASTGFPKGADADLISRLEGLAVYDTDLNITWVADPHAVASNPFGLDPDLVSPEGIMAWVVAVEQWLPAMNTYEGSGYLGFNDWRMPNTLQPDPSCSGQLFNPVDPQGSIGADCTGSELGHLFYNELGGTHGNSILTSGDPDLALFTNIGNVGAQLGYWSGTEVPGIPDFAYYFFFDDFAPGHQGDGPKFNFSVYVPWAVRDGDVAIAVPEPGTLALLGTGVIGILARRRRPSGEY